MMAVRTPPSDRSFEESTADLSSLGTESHPLVRERIGTSLEGRPIYAWVLAAPSDRPRLLVIAGQHGDEPWGRAAVMQWVERMVGDLGQGAEPPALGIAAVVRANPDGAEHGTRENAGGTDLNRDHFQLSAPETVAVHQLVRQYRPHFLVDVHNYPARRRILLKQGWVLDADVQLALPTHPAVRTALGPGEWDSLLSSIQERLAGQGRSATPYTLLGRSGRARPSTLGTRDARNAIALRYGIPTLLLEGKDPGRERSDSARDRTVSAQAEALYALAAWVREHRDLVVRGPPIPAVGEVVPVRAGWVEDGTAATILLRRPGEARSEAVRWPRFAGGLRVHHAVSLPRAYAVRKDLRATVDLLERHEIVGEPIERSRYALATAPVAGGRPAGVVTSAPFDLKDYVSFSVHQRGGRALAVWLERFSRSSALERDVAAAPREARAQPPILRVELWDYRPPATGPSEFRDSSRIGEDGPASPFPWFSRSLLPPGAVL